MTVLINIFSFVRINQVTYEKLLYDKTVVSFQLHNGISLSDVIKKLNDFSRENNIEIAQYNTLGSAKKDIYSTQKETYNEISFISNIFSDKKFVVHDFNELLNVGFKNLLYVNTQNEEIIQKLADNLNSYCDIQYSLPVITSTAQFITGADSLPVYVLFYFLCILILFFYYSQNKKDFFIYKLWGYTSTQTYCALTGFIAIPLFIPLILNGILSIVIMLKLDFSNLLLQVTFNTLKFNVLVLSLVIFLSIITFILFFTTVSNNSRKRMSTAIGITNILRFFLLFLILLFINNYFDEKKELNGNLENLSAWNDTQNLFNLQEIYSPFNYSDLAAEDVLNNKILSVYQDLCSLNKVFIVNTSNFERLTVSDGNYDYTYLYDLQNEEDLYTPNGLNIIVDKNYLKRHTINSIDGTDVADMIDTNSDVLNLLVPLKYNSHEYTIEKSFKEWFYFQRVTVANMYRTAGNKTEFKKNIDNLKINIIYIKNGQKYFTYNPYTGDNTNTIADTIVTVYTENIDPSNLGSYVGKSVFVEAENEYSALKEIGSITKKYNVNELNSVASVYDKKGDEISYLRDQIKQLSLAIMILFILLILFMIVICYFYLKLFFREIIIKSLFGYSFTHIYKVLFKTNLLIYIGVILLMIIVYKRISLHMFTLLFSLLITDYLVCRIVNKYLLDKGEIQCEGKF